MGGDEQDPPMVAMIANASSGDINNVNFRTPRPAKKPYEQIRFVADDIATKVHAALTNAEYSDKVSLDARFREPAMELPQPTAEQFAWAKERLTRPGPKADEVDLPYSYARRVMNMTKREAKANVPLQVLRIGPACIGTMPGEPFCEIGLEFRERSGHAARSSHRVGPRRIWLHPNRQAFRMGRLRDVARLLRVRAARLRETPPHADGNGRRSPRCQANAGRRRHRGDASTSSSLCPISSACACALRRLPL